MRDIIQEHLDNFIVKIHADFDVAKGTVSIIEGTSNLEYIREHNTLDVSKPTTPLLEDEIILWEFNAERWSIVKIGDIYKIQYPLLWNHVPSKDMTPSDIVRDIKVFDRDQYIQEYLQRLQSSSGQKIEACDNTLKRVLDAINVSLEEYHELDKSEFLEKAKINWVTIIREFRDKALTSLDREETEAKKENDDETLEEIEIIKQMLRDIPQDVVLDFSKLTSLKQVASFWPPLLLPAPDFVLIN